MHVNTLPAAAAAAGGGGGGGGGAVSTWLVALMHADKID
jgi:hypothetical protein